MKRPLTVLALIAGILVPNAAYAQSVMVLGIRSVEGDDEFTRNLTGALRNAASQVESWDISDREVTLSQMSLAHGCDEPDPTCMSEIADSLSVTRVIYGDVRRTSTGDQFDFSINLHLFNGETDEIEHSVADTIPGVRRDIDDLREPARRWIAALSGAPRSGTLNVTVNVPGAEVRIDGDSVGLADDDGHLSIEGIEAGTRRVEIVAEGHTTFRGSVSIEPYGESSFEADLEAGGGGGEFPLEAVIGGALLAVGAGLAAGWIYSMVRIDAINSSSEYVRFRDDFTHPDLPMGVTDVCSANIGAGGAVLNAELNDLCSEASTLEALQFVFGIGAAAAAGVGLYFLITGLSGDDSGEQAVILTPSIGPDHAYLGALVSF